MMTWVRLCFVPWATTHHLSVCSLWKEEEIGRDRKRMKEKGELGYGVRLWNSSGQFFVFRRLYANWQTQTNLAVKTFVVFVVVRFCVSVAVGERWRWLGGVSPLEGLSRSLRTDPCVNIGAETFERAGLGRARTGFARAAFRLEAQ